MSDMLFWGLTKLDFQDALWNSAHGTATAIAGFAAAGLANAFVHQLMEMDHTRYRLNTLEMKPYVCTFLGIGAGALATIYAADRLPQVSVVAEKALKFLAISFTTALAGSLFGIKGFVIGGLTTAGGAWGYYGRSPLYVTGYASALAGSVLTTKYLG
jgi:hypothetical protein